jgi:hypothetical protein
MLYPQGSQNFFHHQDQQILRLLTAAARSHQVIASTSANFFINNKIVSG